MHTYTETTDEIVNPAAGFYKRVNVKLKRNDGNLPADEYGTTPLDFIRVYSSDHGMLQLCFDLADFSKNAGGEDAEIDAAALSVIERVFGFLREQKLGAIVRFDYNRDGTTFKDESGNTKYKNAEPALELVLQHIKNVSAPITEYSDVILGVESGMLGPWGEQHSTELANSGANTFYRLVDTWLEHTPESMGITVRRPLFFTYWVNQKYGLDLSAPDLADFDFSEYPAAKRVGVFNDGYLGSDTDLGTFINRAAEIVFIGKQAERTYYGGELVADGSQGGVVGDNNRMSNLEKEAFITHTSYLNIDWNYHVFEQYQANTYDGVDLRYKGKTSEFTFLKNRLGYRFYLSESTDPSVVYADQAPLKFTIANAGFARILVPTHSELVFTDGTDAHTVDCTAVDLAQIGSADSKEFEFNADISNLPFGDYDVYLRSYTNYGAEIMYANDLSICATDSNGKREGVKIATFTKAAPILTGIAVTTAPTKTVYTVGDAFDMDGLVVTAAYSDGTTEQLTVTADMLSGYDTSTAGEQTVTVTYENKTATFDITVEAVVLTEITATYSGKQYFTSQSFDRGELTVKALYSDNSDCTVTDYTLSDFDMTAGVKTVTVTYVEDGITKTCEFSFTVNAVVLSGIAITTPPTNTIYTAGDAFDIGGLAVTATYSDGTTERLTVAANMLTGFDMDKAGIQTVTVTYENKTATFNITVVEPPPPVTLNGIAITTQPAKKMYAVGETPDITGLVVTATYSDGTTEQLTVTADMLSGFDMSTAGTQTVTITYENKTATYNIAVLEEQTPEPPPTDEEQTRSSFFERLKNFLADNVVGVGCVSAGVLIAFVVIIIIAVKRKK